MVCKLRTAILLCSSLIVWGDVGFDIFFTTNLDEILDSPIVFDKPLPTWLRGSLIRNGVGRFEIGNRHVTTTLDAYAKLSKWTFGGSNLTQTARFSTKFVDSDSYTKSVKAGDIVPYIMLGPTNPKFEPWQIMLSMLNGADNMNVNIFNYGGTGNNSEGYVITSDFWKVYEINPHNLSVIKPIKPPVPGAPTYKQVIELGCSHSLPEYGTTNHITLASLLSVIPGVKSMYVIYRATSAENREQIAAIEVDQTSYVHSFALTMNYMVLIATPLYIDPVQIIRTLAPEDAFEWKPENGVVFYVVNLKTGFVNKLKTESFFFLHHVNSFENIFGELVIDLATFENADALRVFDLKNLKNSTLRTGFKPPLLKRFTVDVPKGTIGVTTFPNLTVNVPYASTLDFPTINENFRFKQYCFIYGVVYAVNGSDFLDMALVKKDICTGKGDKAWYKKGNYFNEAFFVARPGSTEEDDGVLLVHIIDTNTKESAMVIFDAKTLEITNKALLPTTNPFGTHGRFFPEVV